MHELANEFLVSKINLQHQNNHWWIDNLQGIINEDIIANKMFYHSS